MSGIDGDQRHNSLPLVEDSVPLDIILSVLSFMRLIDLCRLLKQCENEDLFDTARYIVQSRAKAEAWELAVYTPAGYTAALCHGDREGHMALARLRCVGYNAKRSLLRFESDNSVILTDDYPPPFLILVCMQWPRWPTEDSTGIQVPIVCGQEGQQHQGMTCGFGAEINYRMTTMPHGSSNRVIRCNACHGDHCHPSPERMHMQFQSAQITFEWLRRGLVDV